MKDDWQAWESTHYSIALGAGSIVSNPTDLNRFINCLFKGDLVKKENLDKMMEMVDGYGYGMFSVPFNEKSGFGHTGGIDGFQSNCFYFPEDKLSVSYLSNGTKMLMNDVLIGVLSIYFDLGYILTEVFHKNNASLTICRYMVLHFIYSQHPTHFVSPL